MTRRSSLRWQSLLDTLCCDARDGCWAGALGDVSLWCTVPRGHIKVLEQRQSSVALMFSLLIIVYYFPLKSLKTMSMVFIPLSDGLLN